MFDIHLSRKSVYRNCVDLNAQIRGTFIERCMSRGWDDPEKYSARQLERFWLNDKHFWLSDPLDPPSPVPIRLYRHDDTLGTTRCHYPCWTFWCTVHFETHWNDFGLHFTNSWENVGMEWIWYTITSIGCDNEFWKIVASIWVKLYLGEKMLCRNSV